MLRRWPLPVPDGDDDKKSRGRVLVVGGEASLPGAVVLAGMAALRAGAGKLQIATCRSIAPSVGVAVPEALALGLDETAGGTIAESAVPSLRPLIEDADAVLVGPGMRVSDDNSRFVLKSLPECTGLSVVLDAGALGVLASSPDVLEPFGGNAVITPHAGEMATILGTDKDNVDSDPAQTSIEAAKSLSTVVALKGSTTYIATPDGDLFYYDNGDVGLATSGSGDTLAGIVAGLIARGCDPLHATLWGVFLHGEAGNVLAKRMGRIGYLARELLDEIPALMNET
jgi:ADP-dependent NAD(P)H-hydrate dehydratase